MKKVYLFPAIAVMAAMTACTKEPVNTTVPEDELVPVQFGLASPDYSVTTKSTGGLDQWNNTTLYVYGFDRKAADYSTPFIDNVSATAASTASISLTVINEETQESYYYEDGVNYDFYGYHVDDAATPEAATPTPIIVPEEGSTQESDGTALTKGVYIPFTINGSQDLMVAKADPAVDIVGTELEDVGTDRVYSAYAARRDVHPTLEFKHQLARFKFQIKSGATSGDNVYVTSIKILDQKQKGYLRVVGETQGIVEATNGNDPVDFALMEKDTDGSMKELTEVKPENPFVDGRTQDATEVGESIMILPGGISCEIALETRAEGITTAIPEQRHTILASELLKTGSGESAGATSFDAGKYYTITIIIYGPEEIEITATLDEWEDGGGVEWDPDK